MFLPGPDPFALALELLKDASCVPLDRAGPIGFPSFVWEMTQIHHGHGFSSSGRILARILVKIHLPGLAIM
jgi:hypothetical protein